jgi:hypothetical protein
MSLGLSSGAHSRDPAVGSSLTLIPRLLILDEPSMDLVPAVAKLGMVEKTYLSLQSAARTDVSNLNSARKSRAGSTPAARTFFPNPIILCSEVSKNGFRRTQPFLLPFAQGP